MADGPEEEAPNLPAIAGWLFAAGIVLFISFYLSHSILYDRLATWGNGPLFSWGGVAVGALAITCCILAVLAAIWQMVQGE